MLGDGGTGSVWRVRFPAGHSVELGIQGIHGGRNKGRTTLCKGGRGCGSERDNPQQPAAAETGHTTPAPLQMFLLFFSLSLSFSPSVPFLFALADSLTHTNREFGGDSVHNRNLPPPGMERVVQPANLNLFPFPSLYNDLI